MSPRIRFYHSIPKELIEPVDPYDKINGLQED